MPLKLNVNGIWKDMSTATPGGVHINVGGAWKVASEGWININGVWKKIWPESSGGATGTYYPGDSYGMTIVSNGSYYLIGGTFKVGGSSYAFAKSKSTFNPTYIVLHQENAPVSTGVWCTWSMDAITWYYEEVNHTNWEFYGARLFGQYTLNDPVTVPNCCTSLVWNGTVWVAGGWSDGGYNSLAVSYDGTTWTPKGSFLERVNGVGWNVNKWAIVGYDSRVIPPNTSAVKIYYSNDTNANSWYGGVNPFSDIGYYIVGNGAQWVCTGRDTGLDYKLKTSNTHDSWVTRYDSDSSIGCPVWDLLNLRWLGGSGSNILYDGGIKSSDGVTWSLIGMGSRYFEGREFVINSSKYLYLGRKLDPLQPLGGTSKLIIANRNNVDSSWTTLYEFPTNIGLGVGHARHFATNNFNMTAQINMD